MRAALALGIVRAIMATPPTSRPPASRAGANALGQQLQAAFGLHAQGRTAEAEAAAKRILKIAPKEPNALYLLGIIAHQAGDAKTAAQHFEKSYKADRNSVAALSGLGIVRLDQQRHGEAKGLFEKALKLQPGDPMLLNNLGLAQKGAGDLERACRSFEAAFKARPDFAAAALNLGETLGALGRPEAAERVYRSGLARDPGSPELNNAVAALLADRSDIDGALEVIERASADPRGRADPEIVRNHANLLINKNRLGAAEEVLRAGLEARPDAVTLLVDLGDLLRARGGEGETGEARKAEARALYERAASLGETRPETLAQPIALHRMAAALDQLKRYEDSFAYQMRAQSAWKRQAAERGRRYDRTEMARSAERTIEIFSEIPAPRADDPGGSPSTRPIFILGMPRSGTSLAEQILASHPDVFGAGELPTIPELIGAAMAESRSPWPDLARGLSDERRSELAARYLDALPEAAGDAPFVVDKLPPNFWYLGFIRLLFPRATIIHTMRHPIDVCLSIFTQRFSNDLLFDHDLSDLAHYYRQYRRLMDFWEGWEPALIPLSYERMVADQDGETRRLIERLGLAWDDRVLAFHETDRDVLTASRLQVRQPIYSSSVEKWRRYETGLTPLIEALGPLADYQAYLAARGL